MKFSEIFKGRFGDFYLYKIWTFTVIIGAVLDVSVIGDFSSFFGFVFLSVLFGIIYCIPSLVLSDILYKFLSRSKLTNYKVLIFTIIFSLVTTNVTYYLSYVDKMGNLVPWFYSFYKIYNICLIAGFFIFQQKTKIKKNDKIKKTVSQNFHCNNYLLLMFCANISIIYQLQFIIN